MPYFRNAYDDWNYNWAGTMKHTTVRDIALTPQGNLVVDIPVPARVAQAGKLRGAEEATHMRYTAVTCGPDAFSREGYTLRQQEYGRQTELFIVVTMYNEDDALFCKTLTALQKNIAHLCTHSRSRTWGKEGWQKVVICIVSDGRKKIHPRVLSVLGVLGVYQDGVMKDHVNEKPVTAHLFEYTTQIAFDMDSRIRGPEAGIVPVQVLFCLKEQNAKKINSHRWFFNAFGPLLRPNVCVLIDVGTKPTTTSIYHLWKAFDRDPSIGGACGEIYAETGRFGSKLLNPLVAAQNFEYKMSNILDKPFESVCGYISVLPGAFSAYRYTALRGRPLAQYFKGEDLHGGTNYQEANMYLAEDRILCFELVTKRDQAWLLKYVKSAKAETDVPDSLPEFISQRRRWLNGSFFAGLHALTHWYYFWRSHHSFPRKLLLMFELFYNLVNMIFNWFALSSWYLTFYFLGHGVINNSDTANTGRGEDPFWGTGTYVFPILRELYLACIVLIFICSLGNRPQGSKWIYMVCVLIFALIQCVLVYLAGWTVFYTVPRTAAGWEIARLFNNAAFRTITISILSTYGLYLLASLAFFEPWHMFTCFIQYLLAVPSFVNVTQTYAFCNLHDVSWGTKGDNMPTAQTDLGAAQATKKGGKGGKGGKKEQLVAVAVPTDPSDINANYTKFLQLARAPRVEAKAHRDARTKSEDYFRNFRTRFVVFWMFSNAALIIMLTTDAITERFYPSMNVNAQSGEFNPYLSAIFYAVAALAAIRAIGSFTYLLNRVVCG